MVFDEHEFRAKATSLIEASLNALVGVKHRVLGVLPVGPIPVQPLPSLISIAPAVWNYGHFQAVAARAAFIPTISRLLTSFCADAQSPRLQGEAAESLPGTQVPIQRTEAKLHEIVLKGVPTSLPTRKRKPKAEPKMGYASDKTEKPRAPSIPPLDDFSMDDGESYTVVDEGTIHTFQDGFEGELFQEDEKAVCWQDIEEWPELDESWPWDEMDWEDSWEDNDRRPGEEVSRVFDVDDMDEMEEDEGVFDSSVVWQEVKNWQLEGWEANEEGSGTGDPWQVGEEADGDMGYMDIDENGVDMWQDGCEGEREMAGYRIDLGW